MRWVLFEQKKVRDESYNSEYIRLPRYAAIIDSAQRGAAVDACCKRERLTINFMN